MPTKNTISTPRSAPSIVFFDLDETLIINEKNPKQHLTAMYDSHICPLAPRGTDVTVDNEGSRAAFNKAILGYAKNLWFDIFLPDKNGRMVLEDMFSQALATIDLPHNAAAGLVEDFILLAASTTTPAEGAKTTLQKLQTCNIKTGMISNGFTALQTAKLHHVDLAHLIDTVIVSEDAGAHKPNKQVFEYALTKAGHAANSAWHIGDHPDYDVRGSRACGLTGIFYDPTGKELSQAFSDDKPDHTVQSFKELDNIIEALL